MKLAQAFANSCVDDIKAVLNDGRLVIYSLRRPASPDARIERSGAPLATFRFGSQAFNDTEMPLLEANPVVATGTGTPGFARAFRADGTPVADFCAGPGGEIRLSEVSATSSYPIALASLKIEPEG